MITKVDDIRERMVKRYNKFTQEFKEELKRQKAERLEDLRAALKAARERMLKTTDATEEELEVIARAVEKEMRETLSSARETLRKLETQAWERPSQRVLNEARSLLKGVSGRVKTVAGGFEGELERSMTHFKGEVVESGTFACRRCGKEVFIPFPANLPECSDCGGIVFRKK